MKYAATSVRYDGFSVDHAWLGQDGEWTKDFNSARLFETKNEAALEAWKAPVHGKTAAFPIEAR